MAGRIAVDDSGAPVGGASAGRIGSGGRVTMPQVTTSTPRQQSLLRSFSTLDPGRKQVVLQNLAKRAKMGDGDAIEKYNLFQPKQNDKSSMAPVHKDVLTAAEDLGRGAYDFVAKPVIEGAESIGHTVKAAGMAVGSMAQGHHGQQLAADKRAVVAEFNKGHLGQAAPEITSGNIDPNTGRVTGAAPITAKTIRKGAGAALEDSLNVASVLPAGKAASVGKDVIEAGVKTGIKAGAKRLGKAAAEQAKVGAAYGAAFGGATTLQEDDPTLKSAAVNVGGGAAVGAGLGAGVTVAGAGAAKGAKTVIAGSRRLVDELHPGKMSELLKDESGHLGGTTPEPARPIHEVPEDQGIKQLHDERVSKLDRNLTHYEKAMDKVKELADQVKSFPRQYNDLTPEQRSIKSTYSTNNDFVKKYSHWYDYWSQKAPAMRKSMTDAEIQGYRKTYQATIKKAISTGKNVPQEIIDSHPEFARAATARARYDKGRHTSFANASEAVDYSTKPNYGIKVKRQDGKPMEHAQVHEITQALHDFETHFGPVRDILDHHDITVAHTNGKMPFMNGGKSSAQYAPGDKTISIGMKVKDRPIQAFAHELSHALDHMSEVEVGSGDHKIKTPEYDGELMADARRSYNGESWKIERDMKLKKNMTEAEKDNAKELKARLGPYWNRHTELMARMVEQLLAMKAGKGTAAAHEYERYTRMPGYWGDDVFKAMAPRIEKMLEGKIDIARKTTGTEAQGIVHDAAHILPEPSKEPVKTEAKTTSSTPKPSVAQLSEAEKKVKPMTAAADLLKAKQEKLNAARSKKPVKSDGGRIKLAEDGTPISKAKPEHHAMAAEEAKKRMRKFSKRVATSEEMPPPVRDATKASEASYYKPLGNAETIAKAKALVASSEEEALTLAKHGQGTDANAAALQLMEKYIDEGNYEKFNDLHDTVSPRFTKEGQSIQILATMGRLKPAGAVKFAKKEIEKLNSKDVGPKRAARHTAAVKAAKTVLAKEGDAALDGTLKDLGVDGKKGKRAAGSKGGVQTANPLTPEERLAARINVPGDKKRKPDPITDMVDTLHKVAKEGMPPGAKPVPRSPMEFIGQAVRDRAQYKDVWDKAKELVEQKYKGNDAALEQLDSFFTNPLDTTYAKGQLKAGVTKGLKDEGVDLGKLVRDHWQKTHDLGGRLVKTLTEEAGLTEAEATGLASDIRAEFTSRVRARKQTILTQMNETAASPTAKKAFQKVLELKNLGAFDEAQWRPLINKKFGIKDLSNEGAARIRDLAEAVQQTPEGSKARIEAIGELMKGIHKEVPSPLVDKLLGTWKAGLLTGLRTHGGNLESNASFGALRGVSKPGAVLVDKIASVFTKERKVTMGLGELRAGAKGTIEGFQASRKVLKTGIDERTGMDTKYTHGEINFKTRGGKLLGKYVNGVFRLMAAGDRPFYYDQLHRSLYDLAKADALTKKIPLGKRGAHIKALIADPTADMVSIATNEAEKAVLGNETFLGKAVGKLSEAARELDHPLARAAAQLGVGILMPFSKVPAAFIGRVFDFTPVGALKEVASQASMREFDQRKFAFALSEATTGTAAIYLGANLAAGDYLSGDYPKDPKEQQRWKEEGITPNSLKWGNNWISLNYLGPIGALFGIGKNVSDALASGAAPQDALLTGAAGAATTVLGQSFLQGLSNGLQALNEPGRYMDNFVKGLAGSVVPTLLNDVGNATDHLQRETDSALEAIQSRIPGWRTHLRPKQTALGNTLDQPADPAGVMANPLRPSKIRGNAITDEIDRLKGTGKDNFVFPTPDKTLSVNGQDVPMSKDEAYQYNGNVGRGVTAAWGIAINSSDYKDLSDNDKATVLLNLLKDTRQIETIMELRRMAGDNGALSDQVKLTKRQVLLADGSWEVADYAPDDAAATTDKPVSNSGGSGPSGLRATAKGGSGGATSLAKPISSFKSTHAASVKKAAKAKKGRKAVTVKLKKVAIKKPKLAKAPKRKTTNVDTTLAALRRRSSTA